MAKEDLVKETESNVNKNKINLLLGNTSITININTLWVIRTRHLGSI